MKLFKTIGLHQLLWPSDGRFGGRFYRSAMKTMLWINFGLQIMQIVRLYLSLKSDLQLFAYVAVLIMNGLMCVFKGLAVTNNADLLRPTLDLGRYDFTGSARRDPSKLDRCRASLSGWLWTFVTFSFGTLFIWLVVPFFVEDYVTVANLDGSFSRYRVIIYNMWFPVPEAVYKWPPVFALIYLIETIVCSINVFSWSLFDCYLVTMCFVLNAQLLTLTSGCETIGCRRRLHHDRQSLQVSSDVIDKQNEASDYYDDLVEHKGDIQKTIKKMNDFYDIVQPVVLIQISNGSFTIISLIFLTILTHLMGWPILSPPVVKFSSALMSTTIELYIYCYAFNLIESAKSTLNTGLYSTNWTAMDLKFKKLLLIAMNMNSANNRVMKVSPRSIINLEMFSRVMNMAYSIVSVLLNSSVNKTVDT